VEHGLEVIDEGTITAAHPAPLLFVHGAWHAAWCWNEHFLDFFAESGYRALALSLRGHGGSQLPRSVRTSMADYVDDVASVAEGLPSSPVVIAHSMGGFVVQHYLQSYAAPAAVLVASTPPQGSIKYVMRQFKRHPLRAILTYMSGKSLRLVGGTPALARENFFSAQTPEDLVARNAARLQEERGAKWSFDQLFLSRPRPERVTTPMLVLGAESDGSITQAEVRATAQAYRTDAEFFPGMGHDMMLERGWESVADRIHTWLGTRGL
jgi:pimeloyl-ACP methyl ester carboxylesterase